MTTSAAQDVWELVEHVELAQITPDPCCCRLLPASLAKRLRAIPLCQVNEELMVVCSQEPTPSFHAALSNHLGSQPYRVVRGEERALVQLLRQVYAPTTSLGGLPGQSKDQQTVEMCDEVLRAAVTRGASDIHLLPEEERLRVRLRVDGVLEDYRTFPHVTHAAIVSRFKVMAGMNIAEKRVPQDGRFTIQREGSQPKTDVRVASIPTRYGERLTMRLFSPLQDAATFQELGMRGPTETLFSQTLSSSHGMILLTGPTGCGKSTTLHAAMTRLLESKRGHLVTVEDPIEHEIPGASQIEVDSSEKVTFTRVLRSLLRHDPDVIMIGEIRDRETAEIAVKASLTGHLVLSTLHTNTATGAVTRLIDMGVEPFLVGATLRLAVAQRLVRRLCEHCRRPTRIDLPQATILGDPRLAGQTAWEPVGCVYCMGRGYWGRVGLFEMMPVDAEVLRIIQDKPKETDLIAYMQKHDHALLAKDGVQKILDGTTTVQEVASAVATW